MVPHPGVGLGAEVHNALAQQKEFVGGEDVVFSRPQDLHRVCAAGGLQPPQLERFRDRRQHRL
jgi:hypothetical protein